MMVSQIGWILGFASMRPAMILEARNALRRWIRYTFEAKRGQKDCLFTSGIPAAHHANGNVSVKGAITGCARSQTMTDQFFFTIYAEITRRRTTSDDQRFCFPPRSIDFKPAVRARVVEIFHSAVFEAANFSACWCIRQ